MYYIEYIDDKDPLTIARLKGILIKSYWNASKIYNQKTKIVVQGLNPLRPNGKSIYIPFLLGGYELEIKQ